MRPLSPVAEHDLTALANIGDCILEERRLTDTTKRDDARSIGYMMVELMEPATSFLNGQTIESEHPEKWNDNTGIRDVGIQPIGGRLCRKLTKRLGENFIP